MKRGQFDYPRAEWVFPVMVTAENWRNLAEDVDGAVAGVANGYDPVAAGNLIRFFHFALQDGALFDHRTNLTEAERGMLDFVAMAFGRYVEGNGKKSLDHAFGVKRGQGNISTGLGPKANGGIRPLGIPTVADRIAQMVVKQVLDPELEQHFHPVTNKS